MLSALLGRVRHALWHSVVYRVVRTALRGTRGFLRRRYHSVPTPHVLRALLPGVTVVVVPCLVDNYAYVVMDVERRVCVAIDPVDARAVRDVAAQSGCELVAVLCTHHHWDHSGGNDEMAAAVRGLRVYGSTFGARIMPAATHLLRDGDLVEFSPLLRFRAHHTPCHTRDSLVFEMLPTGAADASVPLLFTGDTLFAAGCGRFFEGTPAEMLAVMRRLAALDPRSLVFAGHEYTARNLEFALSVDPHNAAARAALERAHAARAARVPSLPTQLAAELLYNPFLRVAPAPADVQPSAADAAGAARLSLDARDVCTMRVLRARKDAFRPPPASHL